MLIDINLLPQKEAKNKTLLVLAIILAAILFLGAFFVFSVGIVAMKVKSLV